LPKIKISYKKLEKIFTGHRCLNKLRKQKRNNSLTEKEYVLDAVSNTHKNKINNKKNAFNTLESFSTLFQKKKQK
jgi:hypothetical protein